MDKPKTVKKRQVAIKHHRDIAIIAEAAKGKSMKEISDQMGLHRTTVARALSSEESRKIINEAKERVVSLVTKALSTVEDAMDARGEDMTNGLKAALAIAESTNVLTKNQNINHAFPKPTVIKRRDGSEVVLGAAFEDEDKAS
jgi:lambda repressor-like predicted transcriptional regulator